MFKYILQKNILKCLYQKVINYESKYNAQTINFFLFEQKVKS
jgi:hypothetical protein